MPWVVVASHGARWGQVGYVSRDWWSNCGLFDKVEVQFGTDGPIYKHQKRQLITVARLVRAVEARTGSRYSREEDEE